MSRPEDDLGCREEIAGAFRAAGPCGLTRRKLATEAGIDAEDASRLTARLDEHGAVYLAGEGRFAAIPGADIAAVLARISERDQR